MTGSAVTGSAAVRRLAAALAWCGAASGAYAQAEPDHAGVPNAGPQLRLNGFADVRYVATDTAGSRNAFSLGQFDLFVRSLLSDRVSILSEIVVHPAPRNQFRIVLERLLLRYSPSDHFNAAAGRFHTAIGYYNAAYHHGSWFQTAAGRPLVAAFESEGGILPIHTLGVSITGTISAAPLGLRYVAEIGNGRASQASTPVPPQPSWTDNNSLAANLGLRLRPERLRGLEVGVSVYTNRVTPDTLPSIRETIVATYIVYRSALVEILAEGVAMRHASSGGPTRAVDGGYLQVSRGFGHLRPYARLDLVDAEPGDPLFGYLGRRRGPTGGIRFDAEEFAAVKLQVSRLTRTNARSVGRFEAQIAFTF